MTPWSTALPTADGYYRWRDTTRLLNAGPTILRAVWLAPDGGPRVLAAGPWSGGLTPVAELAGEWAPLEVQS